MKNEDGSNEIDCKEKTKKIKKERKTILWEKKISFINRSFNIILFDGDIGYQLLFCTRWKYNDNDVHQKVFHWRRYGLNTLFLLYFSIKNSLWE